jgi:hypothetical protein
MSSTLKLRHLARARRVASMRAEQEELAAERDGLANCLLGSDEVALQRPDQERDHWRMPPSMATIAARRWSGACRLAVALDREAS